MPSLDKNINSSNVFLHIHSPHPQKLLLIHAQVRGRLIIFVSLQWGLGVGKAIMMKLN